MEALSPRAENDNSADERRSKFRRSEAQMSKIDEIMALNKNLNMNIDERSHEPSEKDYI